MLQCCGSQGTHGQGYIRRVVGQFRCISASAVHIVLAPADIDAHIAAFAPAQFLQRLPECSDTDLTLWIVCGSVDEHADPPHPLALLLCARSERPCRCRGPDQRNELAPLHAHPNPRMDCSTSMTCAVLCSAMVRFSVADGSSTSISAMSTTGPLRLRLRSNHAPQRIDEMCQKATHAPQQNDAGLTHSITSSARASSDGGTVRASALAVLRLIMSSTFVD